ncbi:MAG TPA: hypothetical protein PKC45_05210, partial [Gemmatales bacterium]|nr:hypothetical protein [Gemmatales bacterium]
AEPSKLNPPAASKERRAGKEGRSLVAVIFNLFVHCIVFTYLLGTGKWVKEVAMAYSLDPEGWPAQAKSFKVRVNRLLLLAMATSIGAALTGAGAQTQPQSWWTLAHPVFAVLIWFVNGWAFWVEYQVILANEVVLRDVKAAADRMRDEAGTLD